ncbi:MAG TPA: hypothetical protein VGR37_23925 [Longimicrobiaceae bacterium]|nr:hypothetical protein [Longimicrobiaceae bacterium]
MSDPFEQFARDCKLRLLAERLGIAPRDVICPLQEMVQHFLVTLSRAASASPFRLIFATPAADPAPPAVRDVLWWAASDAWMLEEGKREIRAWAAAYGYPADDPTTVRLFEQQTEQADSLINLLGEFQYRRLLDLYDRESSPSEVASDPATP